MPWACSNGLLKPLLIAESSALSMDAVVKGGWLGADVFSIHAPLGSPLN